MSENYDLKSAAKTTMAAPVFQYQPPAPKGPVPKIGLIGCGGITSHHLQAYRDAGWEVAAFFDPNSEAAEKRRAEYFPNASLRATADEIFKDPSIGVVDIATHPKAREELILRATDAGKHILSQKPFAVDLPTAERLAAHARARGVRLAVNQNGRWAPYFAYMRQAVKSGLIGDIGSVHMVLNWDHTWTAGTPFADIHHLMFYDFGIHWFDAARTLMHGQTATSVSARLARFPNQPIEPPLLASATVNFPKGMATLAFNGCSRFGANESCTVIGSKGTLSASGPLCGIPKVAIHTTEGEAVAELEGAWFPDGFRGCMGELLLAIEENREPENSAADNIRSMAIVLAAMRSADEDRPVLL
ncbi:MAG: Gfo/Idh/MocA family protein [Verrucomicrobiales bacterium]